MRKGIVMIHKKAACLGIVISLLAATLYTTALSVRSYAKPLTHTVVATVFWIGEPADADNGGISNSASEWDANWEAHFGSVDTPYARQHNGNWPAGFKPRENPFYVALPYSDFDDAGVVKPDVVDIPWYTAQSPPTKTKSIIKNHWVAIAHGGKLAFAQWEDAGPDGQDDVAYVFGTAPPANTFGIRAGIDLSPAVADYLGIGSSAQVQWFFVDKPLKSGPWLDIVTTSQITR